MLEPRFSGSSTLQLSYFRFKTRQRAALIIARIRAGEEPLAMALAARVNGGPTVADLAARYLEQHVAVRVKPKTAVKAHISVYRHILPVLGISGSGSLPGSSPFAFASASSASSAT